MKTSESIDKLLPALLAAQREFPTVAKDGTNPHFNSKFLALDTAIEVTRPILGSQGLVVLQTIGTATQPNHVAVTTVLAHVSGQWVQDTFEIPYAMRREKPRTNQAESKPSEDAKGDPQNACAATTYARRYGYKTIVGLAEEDDDGEAAAGRGRRNAEKPASRPAAKAETPKPSEDHKRLAGVLKDGAIPWATFQAWCAEQLGGFTPTRLSDLNATQVQAMARRIAQELAPEAGLPQTGA